MEPQPLDTPRPGSARALCEEARTLLCRFHETRRPPCAVSVHRRHREQHHDCDAERTHDGHGYDFGYDFAAVSHCYPPHFGSFGNKHRITQICSAEAGRTFLCWAGTIRPADAATAVVHCRPRPLPSLGRSQLPIFSPNGWRGNFAGARTLTRTAFWTIHSTGCRTPVTRAVRYQRSP
jgi:hypothetical protein